MKVTAILNLKGGVAKTTTAVNMAALLAGRHRKKVLLIDADSQCNLTEFMGIDAPLMGSLTDLLKSPKLTNMDAVIYSTTIPGVDIIPAEDSLMDLDLTKVSIGQANATAIRDGLAKIADRYDYCLIDCPPAFNAAAAAALVAADDVLIPIKLDAFSLRGMSNLWRQVSNMQAINPALKVAGLLPTMYYKGQQLREARELLADSGWRIFPSIRRSNKVDDMTFAQTALCICAPHSGAAVDYKRFVDSYLGGER